MALTRCEFHAVLKPSAISSGSDGIVFVLPILPPSEYFPYFKVAIPQVTTLGQTSPRRRPYTDRHSCRTSEIKILQTRPFE
jgi:hypothetical protein